ncbi:hypothetical protein D6789_00225 [Candidatus Woesearchaeota archaeon]|nr:MAG: hypothetical protein D6789_00225 [Candidatus Woesearchaeota archaeon]
MTLTKVLAIVTFLIFGSYHQLLALRARHQRNVIAAMALLAEKLRVANSLEQAVAMLGRTSDDSWGFFGALGAKVEGGAPTSKAILKLGRTPEHRLFSRIVALYEERASSGRDIAEDTAEQLEAAARNALDLSTQRAQLRKRTKNLFAVARIMVAVVAPLVIIILSAGLALDVPRVIWWFLALVALVYASFEWLLYKDVTGAVVVAAFLLSVQALLVELLPQLF